MNQLVTIETPARPMRGQFTSAEFLHMIDAGAFAGMKVELVHGEIERMSPAKSMHAALQAELTYRLRRLFEDRSDLILLTDAGILVGSDTLFGGDVVVATPVPENRMLRPDDVLLVAEVSSTTLDRDLGLKREEYARAGIPNYWVIDVERRVIHRFAEPNAGDYLALASLRFGEAVPVPGTDGAITLD